MMQLLHQDTKRVRKWTIVVAEPCFPLSLVVFGSAPLPFLVRGWCRSHASRCALPAARLPLAQVNVVVVVDGSPSIEDEEWILEQQFAKYTVAAFAGRDLFVNGGTASYVQFSGYTTDEGTFNSTESFNAHVDTVDQFGSGTNIVSGTYSTVETANGTSKFTVFGTNNHARG